MAQNEIDPIDLGALVLLPIAAGMVLGVWSFSIDLFSGYDFSEPLWSVGGADISIALLAAVGSVAWIVATNELDGSDYETYEYGMIVGALGIVPVYEFVPAVQDLVGAHDAIALMVWLAIAGVSTWIAYTE